MAAAWGEDPAATTESVGEAVGFDAVLPAADLGGVLEQALPRPLHRLKSLIKSRPPVKN